MTTPTTNDELLQEYIDMYQYRDDENGMDLHSEHNRFRENLQEIQSRLIEPMEYEIGKEYEFSHNEQDWYLSNLHSFTAIDDDWDSMDWHYIRTIEVPDEVSSAITLLEQEGYIVTKK